MKQLSIALMSATLMLCMIVPIAARAGNVQTFAQQARQAASAGKNSRALSLYELALSESVDQPEAISGPLIGQYWQLIGKTGDFPRAHDFFTALLSQQKTPSATLLATEASATGSYIGWLYQNQLAASVPAAMLQQMDAGARKNYARALMFDPDNFAALYGYAVYESYTPNGDAHMKELLAKLNSLRSSHPHYPWQLVDSLEKNGHPQF